MFISEQLSTVLTAVLVSAVFVVAGLIVAAVITKKQPEDKKILSAVLVLSSLAVAGLTGVLHGIGMNCIKWGIITMVLLTASYEDIRTLTGSYCYAVMIAVAGMIGMNFSDVMGNLMAAGLVLLLMIVASSLSKQAIGGIDIQISATCVFAIGIWKGFAALIPALIVSIIVNLILGKKNKAFPMVPFLAGAFIPVMII